MENCSRFLGNCQVTQLRREASGMFNLCIMQQTLLASQSLTVCCGLRNIHLWDSIWCSSTIIHSSGVPSVRIACEACGLYLPFVGGLQRTLIFSCVKQLWLQMRMVKCLLTDSSVAGIAKAGSKHVHFLPALFSQWSFHLVLVSELFPSISIV